VARLELGVQGGGGSGQDICQDHEQKRAQGVANDADVHLVSSAGTSPTGEKGAVKPLGLMIGADVAGSGGGFVQNDPAAADGKKGQNVAAETLAFGDAKGAKHQVRLLDYMAPKARGAQVAPGDRFTPDQAVQIVDSTGALIDITL
jgi:hypothetical protein